MASPQDSMTYEKSGVSIQTADEAKELMSKSLRTDNPRVLNKFGAFGSVIDGVFSEYKHPVLVLKMEEPGSKQLLAAQHGRLPGIGYDLVNHLINDVVVMGAKPIAVLDTIVCGKLEKDVVVALVDPVAKACRDQNCDLVGGETSEQPRVIPSGAYILSAAAVGVADKDKVIDGSKIKPGDAVIAIASNGLHTNGYTLVRSLLDANKDLAANIVTGKETFLDAVLKPHTCYNLALQELFPKGTLTGLAHITGGGIEGNLIRVLPSNVEAVIDLSKIEILPVFKMIREIGKVPDADMLRSLNNGVGLVAVLPASTVLEATKILAKYGHKAYPIGEIKSGAKRVRFENSLMW